MPHFSGTATGAPVDASDRAGFRDFDRHVRWGDTGRYCVAPPPTAVAGVQGYIPRPANDAPPPRMLIGPAARRFKAAPTAPAAVGTLADVSYLQGSGVGTVAAQAGFSGAALVYALETAPAGVTVDAATGIVSIPTTEVIAASAVTVQAANAAGAATQSFNVTVAAAAPAAVGALADVSYRQGSGIKTVPTAAAFSGAGLAYVLDAAPATVTIDPGTGVVSIPTISLLVATVTVRALNGSGAATQSFKLTVGAAASPGDFPEVPPDQLADAIEKPMTRYVNTVSSTANAAFFGGANAIEAYAAFAGQQAGDAHVLEQLRYNLQGDNCPGGQGGEGLKFTTNFVVAAAIAKRTPRVWKELTLTEKTKVDLLVRQCLVGAAAMGSGHNPLDSYRSIIGSPEYGSGANSNWRLAKPFTVIAARSFLGSDDAVTEFLNGFSRSAMTAALQNAGLTNAAEISGNESTWSNAQVESAVANWTWRDRDITQSEAIMISEIEFCFKHRVANGLNGGAGIEKDGTMRARLVSDPDPNRPELGQIGMLQEFDSSDAEGKRSSASYASWGMRVAMAGLLSMMVEGSLDRTSSAIQALKARVHRGMVDLRYKSDNGYWSYAHAGEGGNNDVWQASTHATKWAWSYNHGIWFDILKPWLDAA